MTILNAYISNKPIGTTTFFCGASDNIGISDGQKIIFNMLLTDSNKYVDIIWNEDVYLIGGFIRSENAPLGSYMKLVLMTATDTVIASYGQTINLFGTDTYYLIAPESAQIPIGLKFRIQVYNSSGSNGEDNPANFKIVGNLILYRATTV